MNMGKVNDISGIRFGNLVVDSFAEIRHGKGGHTSSYWNCTCDCGNHVVVSRGSLKAGNVMSCGCLKAHKNKERFTKHGQSGTRIYKIFTMMKARCENPNNGAYQYYGGRGITICDEWHGEHGFENFLKWALINGYKENLTIDRIDVNGNYEPSNCCWIPFSEQGKNRRNCNLISYKGEVKTLSEWSKKFHIDRGTIRKYQKLLNGDGEKAIISILSNPNHTRKMKKVEGV